MEPQEILYNCPWRTDIIKLGPEQERVYCIAQHGGFAKECELENCGIYHWLNPSERKRPEPPFEVDEKETG